MVSWRLAAAAAAELSDITAASTGQHVYDGIPSGDLPLVKSNNISVPVFYGYELQECGANVSF